MASVAPLMPSQSRHNVTPTNPHNMPHAVDDWAMDAQEAADEEMIKRIINEEPQDDNQLFNIDRPLDTGDKAADAVDYEDFDLSDEDDLDDSLEGRVHASLPEAEGENGINGLGEAEHDDMADLFGEAGDDDREFEDLFDGGDVLSSDNITSNDANRVNGIAPPESPPSLSNLTKSLSSPNRLPSPETQSTTEPETQTALLDAELAEPEDEITRQQLELFETSKRQLDDRLRRGGVTRDSPAALTDKDLFEQVWPNFDPEEIPRFGSLFGGKRAYYLSKTPLKAPKAVNPNRINLDPGQDHDRTFKLPNVPTSRKRANEEVNESGVLFITEEDSGVQTSEEEIDFASLDDQETVGGVTIQDLRLLCEDWDNLTGGSGSEDDFIVTRSLAIEVASDEEDTRARPTKRRKENPRDFLDSVIPDDFASFDNPEAVTAKLSRRVPLDLNDSRLLIDTQPTLPQKNARTVGTVRPKDANGAMASTLLKKFNFSNDDEYELLKENHTKRVRGTLGTIAVEHSTPALNLQYPFYKLKLSMREARNFHRPSMHFNPNSKVVFEKKLGHTKVKNIKGQDVQTTFAAAKDLSLADNSTMLLLEYSEEYPMVLSNFGMGNRLINYYRRKDDEDKERPKRDLGETQILLPNDMSPFSKFGKVEPGETVPTLHNAMFRAPVFQHKAKPTDFLVIRNQTGVHGSQYFLRNIDNLHVVGQEFPSVEIPGTHSRMVTSVAKKRLKVLSFRIYNRAKAINQTKKPWLGNEEITRHFPGTEIAQNRTKMREVMQYDKEFQTWRPKESDDLIEASHQQLRALIAPEDICLIDSMQVGVRQSEDGGYSKESATDADVAEDASVDAKLIPWQASKNFLAACGDNGMIALHGDGDPTGRGEGFSFVKISMKGGFQAPGESVDAKINAQRKKLQTGHSYNVEDQTKAYTATIDRIWNRQAESLREEIEPDLDMEMGGVEDENEANQVTMQGRTPRSEIAIPAAFSRRGDDQSVSHVTTKSNNLLQGRFLQIKRTRQHKYTGELETIYEPVKDPEIAKMYAKRRNDRELKQKKLEEYKPTGDAEKDALAMKAIQQELERLEKNKSRRFVRENQKMMKKNLPQTTGEEGPKVPGQTHRKCANCGRPGHIKTNKKLCPILNGTWPNGVPPATGDGEGETPAPTAASPRPATPGPSALTAASPAYTSSLPF